MGVGDNNTWELSDPKLFTTWVKENIKSNEQKVRLIKYFKSWADMYKKRKGQTMPSGLAFTIWTNSFFVDDKRDDVAFIKTAYEIYKYIKKTGQKDWECNMPVFPNNNVIARLKEDQRENFSAALLELINSGEEIFKSTSKEDCIKMWKPLFGKWFPETTI